MKRSILLAVLPTLFVFAACDRPDRPDRARIDDDAQPAVKVPEPATAGTKTARGVGEGEMEKDAAQSAIDRFQRDVTADPDLAAATNARLIMRADGKYALQGTARSGDVKDDLEDLAEKIVGGDVDNAIEVAND